MEEKKSVNEGLLFFLLVASFVAFWTALITLGLALYFDSKNLWFWTKIWWALFIIFFVPYVKIQS